MNDGKPTGQKPKWWSRPTAPSAGGHPGQGRAETPEPPATDEGDFTLAAPAVSDGPSAAGPADAAAAPDRVVPEQRPDDPASAQATTEVLDLADAPVPAKAETPDQARTPDLVPTQAAPSAPGHDAVPGVHEGAPDAAPGPVGAPRPLHEPDEYRTPPYGGPGPWAPAPPVQRPMAAEGHGVPVPPQPVPQQGPPAPAPQPMPQQAAPQAHPQPQQPAQWVQYDPWGAPGAMGAALAPLTIGAEPPAKRRRSRRGLALTGALVFAMITGVVGGAVGAYVERHGGISTIELPQAGPEDSGRAPDSVAGIAASALPSVVTLHVSGGGASGTGTGFVLDTQGHILTNNHVVDAASSSGDISVTFSSGETASAKLVGKDSGYDLAVVKVTGVSGLKPLPLGNSDNVRVGDPVVAIGAPFDLQNTVTSGIISAKERPITAGGEKGDGSDVSYVDALQTDAPINPGNSGGPLVDSKARVIGINSAIRAAGGGDGGDGGGGQAGSIGLGFAIPINQGKRVAEELINTGKATHPVIGVSLDMQFNGDGARVGEKGKDGSASVTPGGPAAKAGVRPGDVITKVDGQRVHSGEELIVKIRAHRPGDRLELTLTRGGKEQTKTLTLGSSQGD
ncbi:trypsin-like peptidase domain-containing protein [Streptomyces sp. NPDC047971]|uniref:S1C family serine protease n=1 Tax=Streptomyces sp. NPDC047971 TaxID=3154499 RepID=UPI0034011204